MNIDNYYMSLAIQEAKKYLGYVNPNPPVGAVIVKNNEVLAIGAHQYFGGNHAEVNAINQLTSEQLQDATIYVTLEPCCHYGKTPPCVNAILNSKIRRVVIGTLDVNPVVASKSCQLLKEHGIEVTVGVLETECKELIKVFAHFMKYKTPYITYKYAMTLDGKVAADSGDSKWISNTQSRQLCHLFRSQNMGIMVGIGTTLKDNPLLTSRNGHKTPIRIICDSHLRIRLDSQIVQTAREYRTIIAYWDNNLTKIQQLQSYGCELLFVGKNENNELDLKDLLVKLGQLSIDSVYIEGGPTIATDFLKQRLVNSIQTFVCPKIIGGNENFSPVKNLNFSRMCDALKLVNVRSQMLGEDIFIESEVVY
ncbi:bifunctional diaminohydroxyphosphoribosylaminopyrimidine deaminase/5-amino-6-(5-phosphoribosylamino)uracil reductase RibD [Ureaplasma ceti]|uniref:Riboflavin biosynthesis protein RibD n=1 Tax=Ureaplasma ceti TaxID=3119530 RepID=A0ABP9U7E4_9BACT